MVVKSHIVAAVLICGSYAFAQSSPNSDAAYRQSFDKWKNELVEGRQKNWLPLAGLFWLKPGDNTFALIRKMLLYSPKAQPTPALSS